MYVIFRAFDSARGPSAERISLLYNVANLLNLGGSATLLSILTQLGDLPAPDAPRIKLDGVVSYTEGTSAVVLAPTAIISDRNSTNFGTGTLTVGLATNADVNGWG